MPTFGQFLNPKALTEKFLDFGFEIYGLKWASLPSFSEIYHHALSRGHPGAGLNKKWDFVISHFSISLGYSFLFSVGKWKFLFLFFFFRRQKKWFLFAKEIKISFLRNKSFHFREIKLQIVYYKLSYLVTSFWLHFPQKMNRAHVQSSAT